MRKAWYGATGLCILLGCGTLQWDAGQARLGVRDALSAAGLTARGIGVDLLTGTLTLHDLATTGSSTTRVHIGTLRLAHHDGFALIGSASAAPAKPEPPQPVARPTTPATPTNGDATADDIVVTSGNLTYRIKHVELKGTPLSSAGLAALLDGKSGESAEARVRRLTASSISIPQITVNSAGATPDQTVTAHDILFTGVDAGKATTASIGTIGLDTKTSDGALHTAIASAASKALDLVQLVHVAETLRGAEADPERPVFDSLDLSGVKVTDVAHKHDLSAAKISLGGVRLRPLKTKLSQSLALLGVAQARDARLLAFGADLLTSIAFERAEADDLTASDEPGSNPKPDSASGSIASITLGAFDHAVLREAAIRTVSLAGGGTRIAFASADAKSIVLGADMPDAGSASPAPASTITPIAPLVGAFDLKQLAIDSDGTGAPNGARTPLPLHFKLDHVGFQSDGLMPNEVPTRASADFEHMRFDASANDDSTKMLALLGYHQVDLSGSIASRYDARQQTLTVDRLRLSGSDMGDLALTVDLANVSEGIASRQSDVQKASALAMLLKGVVLDLRNDGLMQRIFTTKARMDGTDVESVKAQGINFATLMLPALTNNNPKMKLIGTAIGDFIRSPGTLHIAITPKRGLGFLDAASASNDPSAFFDLLDLQASATGEGANAPK